MIRALTLAEILANSDPAANLKLVRGNGDAAFPGLAFSPQRAVRNSFYVVQEDPQPDGEPPKTDAALIKDALAAGFTRFLVADDQAQEPALASATVVAAEDPMNGAIAIARSVQSRASGKIITVTGSVGKTTVKEMTRKLLEYIHPLAEVEPSALNPNMFRPVLRNVSRAANYDFSVIEVSVGAILRGLREGFSLESDVTVITDITGAHLDTLVTVDRAARAKARILDQPRTAQSVAVLYGDSRFSDDLSERAREMGWARTITYGADNHNDVQLVSADVSTGLVSTVVNGEPVDFQMEAVRGGGSHWAMNAMAAIASLIALEENWRKGIPALESFSPPAGRGNKWRVPIPGGGAATIVNAAFNASHASVLSSIEALSGVAREGKGRKILVLGDMGELGASTKQMHESLISPLNHADIDVIYLVGPNMHEIASSITGIPDVRLRNSEDLLAEINGDLRNSDFVHVKGGNSLGLIPLLLVPLHQQRVR